MRRAWSFIERKSGQRIQLNKATSGIHVVKPDRRAPPWPLVVKTLVNANGMRAARQQVGSAAGEAVKRSMGRGSTHFE